MGLVPPPVRLACRRRPWTDENFFHSPSASAAANASSNPPPKPPPPPRVAPYLTASSFATSTAPISRQPDSFIPADMMSPCARTRQKAARGGGRLRAAAGGFAQGLAPRTAPAAPSGIRRPAPRSRPPPAARRPSPPPGYSAAAWPRTAPGRGQRPRRHSLVSRRPRASAPAPTEPRSRLQRPGARSGAASRPRGPRLRQRVSLVLPGNVRSRPVHRLIHARQAPGPCRVAPG